MYAKIQSVQPRLNGPPWIRRRVILLQCMSVWLISNRKKRLDNHINDNPQAQTPASGKGYHQDMLDAHVSQVFSDSILELHTLNLSVESSRPVTHEDCPQSATAPSDLVDMNVHATRTHRNYLNKIYLHQNRIIETTRRRSTNQIHLCIDLFIFTAP